MTQSTARRLNLIGPGSRPRRAMAGLARRMGYEIRLYDAEAAYGRAAVRRTKLLNARGVTVVLDVGANVGQYANQMRRTGYAGRIVSFEPLSRAFAELELRAAEDPGWECRRVALGAIGGTAEINVSENSYSSSLLEMNKRHLRSAPDSQYVGTETVPVEALDSIWSEIVAAGDRPFLKLDVQGFEMEVLRGARESLADVVGVQAELSLVPLYDGAPLFSDLIEYLGSAGFRLAGIEPGFEDSETGELLQADGIFVRAE